MRNRQLSMQVNPQEIRRPVLVYFQTSKKLNFIPFSENEGIWVNAHIPFVMKSYIIQSMPI